MRPDALVPRALERFDTNRETVGGVAWLTPHLLVLRHTETTELTAEVYDPVFCLVLRGFKETLTGSRRLTMGPGDSMVVSHEVPVHSRIRVAQPDEPYLAVIAKLDLALLRSLQAQVGRALATGREAPDPLAVHGTGPALVDVVARSLAATIDPLDRDVLSPMLRRELHYRLLLAPHGGMLRRLLDQNSAISNVARAIAFIRANYRTSIAGPALARSVGMSVSTLHKHFKQVTAMTPLQYQKELRLLEARTRLLSGDDSVSTTAFSVGYESPNQFSRDYSRRFGVAPGSEIPRRRPQ
ncbi:MAG: AraC family transcriptional regulator [Myxococcota bacterium]